PSPPSPAPLLCPALPPAPQSLRSSESLSSRPQVLNQVVKLVLGKIIRPPMPIFRIEDRPYLFQRRRRPVMQIRSRNGNVGQLRRVQHARVVRRLLRAHIKRLLISSIHPAVAEHA